MTEQASTGIVEDAILNGRLRLRQPIRGHRAGTDAVLLAGAMGCIDGLVVDAGAGVGTVGLAIAQRCPQARALLLERDPVTAALARENVSLNGLAARVQVTEADLTSAAARRAAGLTDGQADLVVSNPPWLDRKATRVSPDERRAAAHAHAAEGAGLDGWMRALSALTRPGGQFALIHRADALGEVIAACENRFGGLSILPIHPKATEPARRIIVRGIRGSRAPLVILPPLVLHDEGGDFTPLAAAIHRGEVLTP